jgi:predicted nuclease with TOPRIM domain
MNSSNHPGASPTTNMSPSSDAIEAKMQTLQASLRQERDKARRNHELATERLVLLQDEVQQAEAAVQERQNKLTEMRQELQRLQAQSSIRETVEKLTKEVGFLSTASNVAACFPFSALYQRFLTNCPMFLAPLRARVVRPTSNTPRLSPRSKRTRT